MGGDSFCDLEPKDQLIASWRTGGGCGYGDGWTSQLQRWVIGNRRGKANCPFNDAIKRVAVRVEALEVP